MRDGERQHQRAQQLALAGAGRADQQAVRAHAVLRRLLEVQLDRPAVRADPDRHPQPVPVGPAGPGAGQVEVVRVAQAEQVGQAEVGGHRRRLVRVRRGRQPQRRQLPGQHLGLVAGRARRPCRRCVVPSIVVPESVPSVGRPRAPPTVSSSSRGGGLDRSRMVTPSTPPSVIRWSEPAVEPPSMTTTHVRPGRRVRRRRVEPRPVGQHVVEHRLQRGDRPARTAGSGRPRRASSGAARAAATSPTPSAAAAASGHAEPDEQVVRRVERGQLGEQRPDQVARRRRPGRAGRRGRSRAARSRPAGPAPPSRWRRTCAAPSRTAAPARRPGGSAAGSAGWRSPAAPSADADHARSRRRRAGAPTAGRRWPVDHSAVRVGVPVVDRLALLADRGAHLRPQLGEAAHVLPAGLDHLLLARARSG